MSCRNCGYEARGRFCSMCGARVQPVASVSITGQFGPILTSTVPGEQAALPLTSEDVGSTVVLNRADWAEYTARAVPQVEQDVPKAPVQPEVRRPLPVALTTAHFRISCPPGSFAAHNAGAVGNRLERAYAVAASMLGVDLGLATITVVLDDVVVNQEGQQLMRGGFPLPAQMRMVEAFRSDAPGEGLERSLVKLLLSLATGESRSLSPLIAEGVPARVMQMLGTLIPTEQVSAVLAEAKSRGELPPIESLVSGPPPEVDDLFILIAVAFIGELSNRFGPERFHAFVRRLGSDDLETAVRAVYGTDLHQVDRAWRKTLKAKKPSGLMYLLAVSASYLRPYPLKIAEILIYLALSVAFGIGLARVQGILLDRALIPRDRHVLTIIIGMLVGAFILVSVTSLRESYLTAEVSESALREMRVRMFSRLQFLHPGYFQKMQTGDIMSRMTSDLAAIQFALGAGIGQALRMVLTLVAAVVTIFFTDWQLAIVAVAGTPLFYVTARYLSPPLARASLARQERLGDAASILQENLSAQPVVKAFGLQQRMIDNYVQVLNALFASSLRLTYLAGVFGLSSNSIASGINLLILAVGSYLVVQGNLTVGTLFAFLALIGQIIFPLQSMAVILQQLQQATGAMDRVNELLHAEPAITDPAQPRSQPPLHHSIRFDHVTFSYTAAEPQLSDLTLEIRAASNVALVGPSGCGKSTVLNLLMRFYDADIGAVCFDGTDIRELTVASVRDQVGVVLQENVLFNVSIRENIRLGRLNATDQEVEDAARAAEIDDLIRSMPQGYDTVVGERGNRLSGGQRQRVAIARAIIRNPVLLLLDEATSALDARTEAAVNETLRRVATGRTTVTVTHRLASVVDMDQIYVLDSGQLVEQGRHDDLLRNNGVYAQLWRDQSGPVHGSADTVSSHDIDRLRAVPLFADVDAPLLSALAKRVTAERIQAGDIIVRSQEAGDTLFVIDSGEADVFALDPDAQQGALAVLRAGDYFGEIALMYDMPRTATIRARTPMRVLTLSKNDFLDLARSDPRLADQVVRLAQQRYAETRAFLEARQ